MSTRTMPFVTHLESLREDRAALAALRRGLGETPGSAPDMYPYVIPWLPADVQHNYENACYLVAALYGLHPQSVDAGNMGNHLRRTLDFAVPELNVATERRFTILLASHPDDLPAYLRQTISFLKSKEQGVNWHQLLHDITRWGHPERYIQRQWANGFWGRQPADEENESTENDKQS